MDNQTQSDKLSTADIIKLLDFSLRVADTSNNKAEDKQRPQTRQPSVLLLKGE